MKIALIGISLKNNLSRDNNKMEIYMNEGHY